MRIQETEGSNNEILTNKIRKKEKILSILNKQLPEDKQSIDPAAPNNG